MITLIGQRTKQISIMCQMLTLSALDESIAHCYSMFPRLAYRSKWRHSFNMAGNDKGSDIAKNSHVVLDRDDWHTNFPNFKKIGSNQILFTVSTSRQFGRWVGYVSSIGISYFTAKGNSLSEMSVEVEGDGVDSILQKFIDEFERNQNQIIPSMIKNTIKRNNWYVKDYKDDAVLMERSSGFRVHITLRKTAP